MISQFPVNVVGAVGLLSPQDALVKIRREIIVMANSHFKVPPRKHRDPLTTPKSIQHSVLRRPDRNGRSSEVSSAAVAQNIRMHVKETVLTADRRHVGRSGSLVGPEYSSVWCYKI